MFIFNHPSLKAINPATLRHYKKHALVMAILLLICGICCLLYPLISGMYLSYLTGMMFMICGFYSLYSLVVFSKEQWKSRLIPALFAVAWLLMGFTFVVNPLLGMNSLSVIFCCLFIIGGLSRIASGFQMRGHAGYGWNIAIGIFDLLIAALWLGMNPEQSYLFTTAFIGLEMIFSAFGFISLRSKLTPVSRQKLHVKNAH